eukprot:GHVP01053068.1.p1 GENE.GHVP01053068.1~~GHVP01053068.1.p1  ORF type:complete len:185 (+),score=28.50 GHVP01053068.1:94-648(+)
MEILKEFQDKLAASVNSSDVSLLHLTQEVVNLETEVQFNGGALTKSSPNETTCLLHKRQSPLGSVAQKSYKTTDSTFILYNNQMRKDHFSELCESFIKKYFKIPNLELFSHCTLSLENERVKLECHICKGDGCIRSSETEACPKFSIASSEEIKIEAQNIRISLNALPEFNGESDFSYTPDPHQ